MKHFGQLGLRFQVFRLQVLGFCVLVSGLFGVYGLEFSC